MSQDPVLSFSGMLRHAMGDHLADKAETFVDMLADDAVMEFPYAPDGWPRRLVGKRAISAYLQTVGSMIAFDRMANPTVRKTVDENVIVLEFEAFGHAVASGKPYEQTYISVIEVRHGSIVRYRDYWNPIVLLEATGGYAAPVAESADDG